MEGSNICYHEKLLENLPRSYKRWFDLEEVYLKKLVKRNSKFLDVGCGDGRTLITLGKKTKNLFGIDHNKKAVEDAKKNLNKFLDAKIIFGEAVNLPFENNYFDIIYSNVLINLSQKKYKALIEMKRVLKEKGKIILSVFSEDSLTERIKLYKKLKIPIKQITNSGKVIFGFDESLDDNFSEQFSRKELKSLFNRVGLKILEIKKVGIGYICILFK